MDEETLTAVKEVMYEIADRYDIHVADAFLFGSRTRNDHRPGSDVDILIVSEDFEDVNVYDRPAVFYREWPYDDLPEPEMICLTPEEFQERKQQRPNIVREAVETGVPA